MADVRKVMKAPNEEMSFGDKRLKWPMLGSPKLDGMRLLVTPAGITSLTMKFQPPATQKRFDQVVQLAQKHDCIFDAEMWSDRLPFNEIMQKKNLWKCGIHVFDMMSVDEWDKGTERPFMDRVEEYQYLLRKYPMEGLKAVDQGLLKGAADLEKLYQMCLNNGLEGVMARPVLSKYKHGRSTLNEASLLKWKKWITVDAKIIGFKQGTRMKENAPRVTNELGSKKQVHKKGDRETTDGVGSIQVQTIDGVSFYAGICKGSNVSLPTWEGRFAYMNRWVEIRYQESGTKDKPRLPGIKRWRPDLDIDMMAAQRFNKLPVLPPVRPPSMSERINNAFLR